MAEFARVQIDSVLKQALELSDEARERFLDETCSRDTDLRAIVERMLRGCESDEPLLVPGGGATGPLWQELAQEYAVSYLPGPGDRLGAYRIVETLGRGGMATVYLAERADGQFEQNVALKVLDATRNFEELAVRFAQERQILATLDHPNIARLIDGGATPAGQPYVVMEYVDGEPIDRYCERLRLTIDERIKLFEQVTGAVQYAHSHLIVHRDIKPSNILVTTDGQPKLLDFGIAKLLDVDTPHIAPETRGVLHPMTPEYASPEQVRAEPLTTASDVYQLGYLLYSLLTGRPPYQCDRRSVADMVRVICDVPPARPSQVVQARLNDTGDDKARDERSMARSTTPDRLRRRLKGDLDNILLTALHKEPAERYASAFHLQDDLHRHLAALPISARRPTARYRAVKFVNRHRAGVAAAALLVLSIAAGIGATAWQAHAASQEARRAEATLMFLTGLFESVDPNVTLGETVTAKELLDQGADKLKAGLTEAPLLRAEMLGVVGKMYVDLGLYREARPLLEEALSSLRALGPAAADEQTESASNLVSVLTEQGELEAAETLAREVVTRQRGRTSGSPGKLANSLSALAVLVSVHGDAAEADSLFREALAIDRQSNNRGALATHLGDFGTALWRRKKYDEAQRLQEEALAIRRDLYGEKHTLVATSLLDVATVLMERGEFPQAEALLREGLDIQLELLGEDHPHTARTLNNLGDVLGRQGKLEESESMHRRALAARRAAFGDDHISIAESLNNIAAILYFRGQYGESADLFEQVLARWTAARGPDHADVLTIMNNLGAARRAQGDYAAAEPVLRKALALRRQKVGDKHPDVAQTLSNLAAVLEEKGALAEAETYFREAIAIWQATLGQDHPSTASGLVSLGKLLLKRGDYSEAEPLLRHGLDVRVTVLDANSRLLAATRLYLGECLLKLKKLREADSLLALSLPVLQDRRGSDDELTRRARSTRAKIDAALRADDRPGQTPKTAKAHSTVDQEKR